MLRGVANIEPAPDEHIDGAIYEITVEHGNVLDGFESVPETYDRRWFESEDGPVLYYQMVKARFVKPRERYVETIQRGYEDWSLPLDGLVRAIEQQRREYGSSERRS